MAKDILVWGKDAGCYMCKNFKINPYLTCEAFVNGIPHSILSGETNHYKNLKGDNNIKFEPLEKLQNFIFK